VLTDIRWLSI